MSHARFAGIRASNLVGLTRLKGWRWLVAGLIVYAIAVHVLPVAAQLGWIILLIAWMVLNLRAPGVGVSALGALCNLAVVLANGGRMPFYGWAAPDVMHVAAGGQTHLAFLADWVTVPAPLPYSVVSLGDTLIVGGAVWLVATVLFQKAAPLADPSLQATPSPRLARRWIGRPPPGPRAAHQ
jgi:hypothetical protein